MLLEKTPELTWLAYTIALTGLLWVPYILQLIVQLGPIKAVWDPEGTHPHNKEWALRAKRAHYNAVENLVIFAPLVILVVGLGAQSRTTVIACMVYFIARAAHYVIHVLAIPVLRTIAFSIGVGCQAVLLFHIIGAL